MSFITKGIFSLLTLWLLQYYIYDLVCCLCSLYFMSKVKLKKSWSSKIHRTFYLVLHILIWYQHCPCFGEFVPFCLPTSHDNRMHNKNLCLQILHANDYGTAMICSNLNLLTELLRNKPFDSVKRFLIQLHTLTVEVTEQEWGLCKRGISDICYVFRGCNITLNIPSVSVLFSSRVSDSIYI